jgi:hypothetical protein
MSVNITAIEAHEAMKSMQTVPEKWNGVAVHTDFYLR